MLHLVCFSLQENHPEYKERVHSYEVYTSKRELHHTLNHVKKIKAQGESSLN